MATQEADHADSPSPRGRVLHQPTDLCRLVRELSQEGVIVPSRLLVRTVRQEIRLARKERDAREGDGQPNLTQGKPMLLTRLVEQVVEYCRELLLGPEWTTTGQSGEGFSDVSSADTGDGELSTTRSPRKAYLSRLLGRCAEIYGLMLLTHSKMADKGGGSAGAIADTMRESRPDSNVSLPDRLYSDAKARRTAWVGEETSPRTSRLAMQKDSGSRSQLAYNSVDVDFASETSSPERRTSIKDAGAAAEQACEIVQDGASLDDLAKRLPRSCKLPAGGQSRSAQPTPFFESVYAIVIRAAQYSIRAALVSLEKHETMCAAQVAVRVEEELRQLFGSRQFGRTLGLGQDNGGRRQVSKPWKSKDQQSAELAARADADLRKLIKSAMSVKSVISQEVKGLEAKFHVNALGDSKIGLSHDAAGAPIVCEGNPKEWKKAMDDPVACTASVDEFIAGLKGRTSARLRRPVGEQAPGMPCITTARSPMLASVLPSPRDHMLVLQRRCQLSRELGRSSAHTPQGFAARSLLSSAATAPANASFAATASPRKPRLDIAFP